MALNGRVLFVGDAARAPDPLTGEGIAQALETAELAARTISIWASYGPIAVAAIYRAAIAKRFALDDLASRAFSRVLGNERGATAWFDLATHNTWSRRQFARWMFEDHPRALPLTPWRWRRGLPQQPGAYRQPVR